MPKKRHPSHAYTKPQTTVPSALASSSSSATSKDKDPSHKPTVNDLLTTLRANPSSSTSGIPSETPVSPTPTLPAPLRALLSIPEGAAPTPRSGIGRRRLPAGPAPPRSWLLESSIYASRFSNTPTPSSSFSRMKLNSKKDTVGGQKEEDFTIGEMEHLPGVTFPEERSLKAMCLRGLARNWDVVQEADNWSLALLPTEVRMLVLSFVAVAAVGGKTDVVGVGWSGLKALLTPGGVDPEELYEAYGQALGDEKGDEKDTVQESEDTKPDEDEEEEEEEEEGDWEAEFEAEDMRFGGNEDFTRLDLARSIGRGGLGLKQVIELVAGSSSTKTVGTVVSSPSTTQAHDRDSKQPSTPQSTSKPDSRTTITTPTTPQLTKSLNPPLLPKLRHLSLAHPPPNSKSITWSSLLTLSTHLPTLQSLSLAHWSMPTLTPSSQNVSMVSPNSSSSPLAPLSINYSGTSFYSHSLDNDFSESSSILAKLARRLYSLQYLDIDGCGSWARALSWAPDHSIQRLETRGLGNSVVDWRRAWGGVKVVSLKGGVDLVRLAKVKGVREGRGGTGGGVCGVAEDSTQNASNSASGYGSSTASERYGNINPHLRTYWSHILEAEHLETHIRRARGWIEVQHDEWGFVPLPSSTSSPSVAPPEQQKSNTKAKQKMPIMDLWKPPEKAPSHAELKRLIFGSEEIRDNIRGLIGDVGDYAEEALFWDGFLGMGRGGGENVVAWEQQ